MKKILSLSALALVAAGAVTPTIAGAQEAISAIMITDVGGVDDKSFNQSAWEGLQAWGEENGKERGLEGFDYLQSNSDSDYVTNINTAITSGFDLIYGIGFKLEPAVKDMAEQYPDKHFAIVDAAIDLPNVASLNFKDHEASFLAGVAAALTTETGHIGFIGGVEGVIIDRFEAGFVAGARAVNPDIDIAREYAGSFADSPRGKQLAAAMFANDVDVIFHASGDTGNGVFSEAKDLVANDPSKNIWVIGVDRDQDAEGVVEVDGKERNITLTSTLKQVGDAVKSFAEQTEKEGFKAGNTVYGLADGGVGLSDGQLSEDVLKQIEEYKEKITSGEIEVPETPED